MKLDIKSDWLLRMAEKEGNGIISVGGLVSRVEKENQAKPTPSTERVALAQLVELQRRKLRLSVEQLANSADVEIEEVLAIEQGDGTAEPRTVYKLSHALRLPAEKMMLLAGLVTERDPRLEKAAVRFAASSAPIGALSPEETKALEEFVRILAD
jgi:transcriptional regulator with XRE-family HTH domain